MSNWFNLCLQDSNSYISELMIFFHDLGMLIMFVIMSVIAYLMFCIIKNKFINRFLLQAHLVEIVWTIIPIFILMFLAYPSMKILYLSDEVYHPLMTVKAMGHQWYWSYEYFDFGDINFDSYMLTEYKDNIFRLLDVDNRMVLPKGLLIRILTSSMDVIHSWAIPSLSLKLDAIPGRINQMPLLMIRPGLFFGQCSEICGANHSFMPIVIESVDLKGFLNWLNKF